MNYNSTTAGKYTLQISNEAIETRLAEDEVSSASNFEVTLSPSLDLNQLSYMQSLDVEVKIDQLQIDSAPLIFQQKEAIKTFLTINTNLARHNVNVGTNQVNAQNEQPLSVGLTDFHTIEIEDALGFLNAHLGNGSNLYMISRYLEVFLDTPNIVNREAFNNLNTVKTVAITIDDLDLLNRYIDIAIFTRLLIIEVANQEVKPTRKVAELLKEAKITAATLLQSRGVFLKKNETTLLAKSTFLNPLDKRKEVNEVLHVQVDPIRIIDLEGFYDCNLTSTASPMKTKISEKKQIFIRKLTEYYDILGKLDKDEAGNLLTLNKTTLEQVISDNLTLLKIGEKLHKFIHIEKERLSTPEESRFFSRHFLRLSPHGAQSKCRFHIDRDKLIEKSSATVVFPPIVSYKLGSSRGGSLQKYEAVTVGPISLTDDPPPVGGTDPPPVVGTNPPPVPSMKISNTITHESQQLPSCCRIIPKLLCVATDFLSESSRQQEKEQFFFSHKDMLTFFKVPLKSKSLGAHFLVVESSQLATTQPFFKVHKARSHLHNFKIMLFDENGEFLAFSRNSIVKIAMTFRPCSLCND